MANLPVKQNAVRCIDCDTTYLGETECPEDPEEHATTPVFVTETPLGLEDDADYYHHGNERYEYDGDEIVEAED